MAFLTIITPTFNAEQLVGKCIESVQIQEFKDYEHVIVDGLSVDATVLEVRKYLEKDGHLKLIVERDAGVYDAMNKGIKQNNSEWYYFLGADDSLYDKNILQIVFEQLIHSRAELVYGNVLFKNQQTLYDGVFDIEKILMRNVCHQAVFYHRSVFEKVGFYKTSYKTKADYDMNLRCWLSGKIKHHYIPYTIAFYADGGISSTNNDIEFENDYPDIVIDAVFSGTNNWQKKVDYLSRIYRKIIQRYSLKTLAARIFGKHFLVYRFPAALWMSVNWPFYFLKNSAQKK